MPAAVTPFLTFDTIQNFKTIVLGILLEALPFLLLGVLVSSLLHTFVSEDSIRRVLPKHPALAIITACLIGIALPLCECGMIPVVRGLIRKGMPVYAGISYILAAPILNPVVFASTSMAFHHQPELVYARMGLAFAVSAAIGGILYFTVRHNPLKNASSHHHHVHTHEHHPHGTAGIGGKFSSFFSHASDEFFDMGKYLLFGILLTALIQTGISRDTLMSLGSESAGGHMFMAGLAYVLSICSTSDAFVAASFTSAFSPGPLLTFLVFGAMLDMKTTLMLFSVFNKKFVLYLMLLITASVLAGSHLIDALWLAK
ncbi:permease [Paenibacillus gansuensis]|uniref:Permease n=1 Tax=Paenibacillus gansuensis TaxID=306542 RepID=A0ABW5P943_9BACL